MHAGKLALWSPSFSIISPLNTGAESVWVDGSCAFLDESRGCGPTLGGLSPAGPHPGPAAALAS